MHVLILYSVTYNVSDGSKRSIWAPHQIYFPNGMLGKTIGDSEFRLQAIPLSSPKAPDVGQSIESIAYDGKDVMLSLIRRYKVYYS